MCDDDSRHTIESPEMLASNMSMHKWAPAAWKTLHVLSFAVTDAESEIHWRALVNAYSKLIPCKKCSEHMQEYVASTPVDSNAPEWSWRFHNAVNYRLGKPRYPWKEFVRAYKPAGNLTCQIPKTMPDPRFSCTDMKVPFHASPCIAGAFGLILVVLIMVFLLSRHTRRWES